jgi:hypothetical protein
VRVSSFVSLLLFVALFVGAWYLASLSERQRHARNRAFAARMGWSYVAEDRALPKTFESTPFGVGHSRRATDVMRGVVRDRGVLVFGYHYETGSGGDEHRFDLQVCVVDVPGRVPIVRLSPENLGTRIATALGGVDVEVESDDFNREWKVWTRDKRAAHALLSPRMIERLLERDLAGRTIAFEPGMVFTATAGKLDLPATEQPFDLLCDLADLVPPFLEQDYPER